MKKPHTFIALGGIVVAVVAAYWIQNKPQAEAQKLASSLPAAGAGRPGEGASSGGTTGGVLSGGGSAAPGMIAVEVGKVETMTLSDEAQAVGSLRSRQGVMLRPEVSGRIAKIGFADGQMVRRGQLLVQLDDTLQLAQLQQAQAQANIARSNLQRNRELVAQNFVSQSALDQSAAALEVAEAQVALARATLARMKIVAPFDGSLGIRSVNVGDYVKDGADLVNIEDTGAMFVDFRLPERHLAQLRRGQGMDAALDALPGRNFPGKIEAVDSLLDANGRSLLVRARLDNPGGLLKSGMFARVRTVFSVRAKALVVPEEALVPQGGKQYLIKVVDSPSGGKQSQRIEARLGARVPGKVEILQGLVAGDTVVVAGQARLMRGDPLPIKVVDIERSGTGAAKPASGAGSAPAVRSAVPA